MRRAAWIAGMFVLVATTPNGATGQDTLTRLRAALGGETALGNVQTIRARGTIANTPLKNHFDIAYAIPGRFVKVLRGFSWSDATWSTGATYTPDWQPQGNLSLVEGGISDYEHLTGFDGELLIPERPSAFWAGHPDKATSALDSAHARLAEFILPLLGATPTSYRVESTSEDNTIVFRATGDREWRLDLDVVTHLPARLSWSYPLSPNAVAFVKRTQTITEFSDYRSVGNLRWPHRLITSIDGKRVEDATVSRYDLNVKLPDKMFRK